jgi:hypothetical protein
LPEVANYLPYNSPAKNVGEAIIQVIADPQAAKNVDAHPCAQIAFLEH